MWRHFQCNEPHITEDVRKFLKDIPLWWFLDPTLKLNNSRTAWPIPAIYISFSSILNALSYEVNLFSRCSSPFKGPAGSLGTPPPIISGTIKASPVKLCTVIVLLKAYQNTKRNFQKYDLWRHNDVITKNNGKIWTSAKPDKLYIIRKVMIRAFRKWNFTEIEWLNQKVWPFK